MTDKYMPDKYMTDELDPIVVNGREFYAEAAAPDGGFGCTGCAAKDDRKLCEALPSCLDLIVFVPRKPGERRNLNGGVIAVINP